MQAHIHFMNMSAHMRKFYWYTEEQNTNELLLRRSVIMRNSAHPSLIRGDHKNRGANRRKNDIDRTIEQYTQNYKQQNKNISF